MIYSTSANVKATMSNHVFYMIRFLKADIELAMIKLLSPQALVLARKILSKESMES